MKIPGLKNSLGLAPELIYWYVKNNGLSNSYRETDLGAVFALKTEWKLSFKISQMMMIQFYTSLGFPEFVISNTLIDVGFKFGWMF